jgi:excisionase family DNA binding protein
VSDGNSFGNLKLLTAEEVAQLLRVNRSSVYRWVEQGLLSAIKVGRTVRFNPDVVKAVLEHGLAQKES